MTYGYYQPQFYAHPGAYAATLQQSYNPQQNQQITTQQQALQPASRIIQVASKEEATGTPVDLINGTPTFFYNKGKNEIYIKQCDISTGTPIFKTFGEIKETEEPQKEEKGYDFDKKFQHLDEGMESIHRLLIQMQEEKEEKTKGGKK